MTSNESGERRRRIGGHAKIGRAYKENRGVYLTPEDVEDLWFDEAIKSAITQAYASQPNAAQEQ